MCAKKKVHSRVRCNVPSNLVVYRILKDKVGFKLTLHAEHFISIAVTCHECRWFPSRWKSTSHEYRHLARNIVDCSLIRTCVLTNMKLPPKQRSSASKFWVRVGPRTGLGLNLCKSLSKWLSHHSTFHQLVHTSLDVVIEVMTWLTLVGLVGKSHKICSSFILYPLYSTEWAATQILNFVSRLCTILSDVLWMMFYIYAIVLPCRRVVVLSLEKKKRVCRVSSIHDLFGILFCNLIHLRVEILVHRHLRLIDVSMCLNDKPLKF